MKKRTIKFKKNRKKKYIFSFLALGVLILGSVFGTYAWLTFHQELPNRLTTGKYNSETHEDFDPHGWDKGVTVKKKVWVENTGTLPVYVRVKIVPFWKDGQAFSIDGKETVKLNFSSSKNWKKIGKFYYYIKPLKGHDRTDNLLESATLSKDLPNEYNKNNFQIDVITESIAGDSSALKELWGLDELPK
ncbi:BsaA family SipW-dependent biofilm matrix protein [Eubacterium multiforme]|uniref:Alternate signal-mediated exported protein, CPF_0494 family n=1 Tax=Eubacterium multiforme TaxID=83339 RepID=A0ABT9UVB7_9FIRM|nr:BsaA family SipW-dependent biofilm matrix protein [Eubacterium multiforme]MDQ0150277.1 hypothetical protein [Eubacterium multiforme]